ncbi:hypothetical protein [Microbispora sp. H10670]|uniref:hypothetical protein n=1 Tax=Microbispora sp. H10670 TaxID=2729108 RepID=UPI0016048E42|nr:hypothetical protein [Microbispora sp. H10670]
MTTTIPTSPLDSAPCVELPGLDSIASARAVWRHALRGLPLGAYDTLMVAWAEDLMDQPTLIAFASLIERARIAGAQGTPSSSPPHGPGVSDLEVYHERVKELRGKGLDAVTARLRAMDEARQRIDEREQAWHGAQAAAEATRDDPEVSR